VDGVSEVAAPGGLAFLNDLTMGASATISDIDSALIAIASKRAEFGAVINRLNHRVSWLNGQVLNTEIATSVMVDADMAKEASVSVSTQIQQQAGMAMAAQANLSNQVAATVLSSLRA
jgi:flagellin